MTYSTFYRTKGAKDKKQRKRRRKTRIETAVQERVKKVTQPFKPEPNVLERAVQYVKDNPGKALMGALGTTALIATRGKQIAKGLEGIVGADIATVAAKNKRYQQLVQAISQMKEKIALQGYQKRKEVDLKYRQQLAEQAEALRKRRKAEADAEKAAKKAEAAEKRKASRAKSGRGRKKTYNPPSVPASSYTPDKPTSASKPLPKEKGGSRTGVAEPKSDIYRPSKREGRKGSRRDDFTSSPALSTFARTRGAKDKRRRKQRRKTRLEAHVEKKVKTVKRMFEPEPTGFAKVVDYVKRNPMKTLAAISGGISALSLMSGRLKTLRKDWKGVKAYLGWHDDSSASLANFARTRGAKDKRRRKRKKRNPRLRVRAIDKDKMKQIGDSQMAQESKKYEVDPKVKEAYLKAQTFRSRLNPIIGGVREARSTLGMLNRMSKMSGNQKLSNFYTNEGMPVVEAINGMQIKGRGGIVKILAHLISSDKTYALEYKPKDYDSSGRYHERYATLLADTQGNLKRSKDVGGKPDREKSQVKGQQGIEAKKGKVGGSLLSRQYSYSDRYHANFEEGMISKLRKRFKKLSAKSKEYAGKKYKQAKEYAKEKYPKAKEYASGKYKAAKKGLKDLNLKRKAGTAALKTAYHTGRYAEKASRAKKSITGG